MSAELASAAPAQGQITVGNPAQPAALPAALLTAYNRGARDITIAPGTYQLPASRRNDIELTDWNNATIRAQGVTIIFEDTAHRPLMLNRCSNVLVEGATLQFAGIPWTQGRIKAVGTDAKGKYWDWQIDAGYPTKFDQAWYNVIDGKTRLLKVGTGDCGAKGAGSLGPGLFRLRQICAAGAAVDDWLVARARAAAASCMADCKACTMKDLTLKNSGFGAFFETGGDGRPSLPRLPGRPRAEAGGGERGTVGLLRGRRLSLDRHADRADVRALRLGGRAAGRLHCHPRQLPKSNPGRRNEADPGKREPRELRRERSGPRLERSRFLRPGQVRGPAESQNARKRVGVDSRSGARRAGRRQSGQPLRCGKGFKILDCTLGNTRSRGSSSKATKG